MVLPATMSCFDSWEMSLGCDSLAVSPGFDSLGMPLSCYSLEVSPGFGSLEVLTTTMSCFASLEVLPARMSCLDAFEVLPAGRCPLVVLPATMGSFDS